MIPYITFIPIYNQIKKEHKLECVQKLGFKYCWEFTRLNEIDESTFIKLCNFSRDRKIEKRENTINPIPAKIDLCQHQVYLKGLNSLMAGNEFSRLKTSQRAAILEEQKRIYKQVHN